MSKIIIIIPDPNKSIDILSLISRFAVELKRANKQIVILRANVASDARVISKLASKYNITRVPCMLHSNGPVIVGQSQICAFIATIIKSIRSGNTGEHTRPRAPCPTVNQYMTQIMLSGEDDVADDDPEQAKEQMAQRMADYRARTKLPVPTTDAAAGGAASSASTQQRRTARTTSDSQTDDGAQPTRGTVVEQELQTSEAFDVDHIVDTDSRIKLRPINTRDVESSVRQSVQRLKTTRKLDEFEDQFYSDIADHASMS